MPIKSIRIGPIDYKVHETCDINDDGLFDMADQVILIQKRLKPQLKRQTLWHEILHGIMYQAGIKEHNERMVDAVAYGIVAALRDNPSLRKEVPKR